MAEFDRPSLSPPTWIWKGALGFFILAGLTGAFFRFAIAGGFSLGLGLGNVRHAHSHTMYFGWVTPALMGMIAHRMWMWRSEAVPKVSRAIAVVFVTAFLAYVPFLLLGYSSAAIGNAKLPLSMIAAAGNVMAWYVFVQIYVRERARAAPSLAVRLFDLSVFFLVLATLGAWGLPALQASGYHNDALRMALTHVFLDIFSEGWFVLGVLGLAAFDLRLDGKLAGWGVRLAAMGIPFTFALGMPASMVSPLFKILSSVGGAAVSVGVLLIAISLIQKLSTIDPSRSRLWRFALAALVVKSLAEGVVSVTPTVSWATVPHLRIIYLHVVLLGFVSVGLVAAARNTWGEDLTRGTSAFVVAVALLLFFLIPYTPLWPSALLGTWLLWVTAVVALAPVAAAVGMVLFGRKTPAAPRTAHGAPNR